MSSLRVEPRRRRKPRLPAFPQEHPRSNDPSLLGGCRSRACRRETSLEEAARDNFECQRLLRTLEDGPHSSIDEVAAHGTLLSVTHAAVHLQRLTRYPFRRAARVQLDQTRLHA